MQAHKTDATYIYSETVQYQMSSNISSLKSAHSCTKARAHTLKSAVVSWAHGIHACTDRHTDRPTHTHRLD